MDMGKMKVKVIGGEVFDLPKRERAKKFDDETVIGLTMMLGDLRAEQERRKSTGSGSFCLCCILPPEDVKRHILLKDGVRYLVMLLETSRGEEIPRGCFFVNSWDGYVFEITEFYVQERYRRKGLGKKMFAAFLRRFRRDRGTRGARITLSVALGNDAAEEFYRQLGFTTIAKDMAMIVGKGKE